MTGIARMGPNRLGPRTVRHAIGLTVTLTAGLALGVPGGPAQAASCTNLRVAAGTKPALATAYHRAHSGQRPRATGPVPGTTYYGRCGSIFWAAATFTAPGVGATDQPETFRRLAGGGWRDLGDSVTVCRIPRGLRLIWHNRNIDLTCGS